MSLERVLQSCPEQLFRNEEERDTFLRRLRRALKKDIHQGSTQENFGKGIPPAIGILGRKDGAAGGRRI